MCVYIYTVCTDTVSTAKKASSFASASACQSNSLQSDVTRLSRTSILFPGSPYFSAILISVSHKEQPEEKQEMRKNDDMIALCPLRPAKAFEKKKDIHLK